VCLGKCNDHKTFNLFLTSATFYWPGSEAEVRGYRPNIWMPYNDSVPFIYRIDKTIEWLTVNKTDIAILYFHEPDFTGHIYGPDSDEIRAKIRDMDKILGYLLSKFDTNKLWDKVNLIVTSDHGMTTIDTSNQVVDITDGIIRLLFL
jgi:predicted AlkP superfamily pyrophosphatase or phosphodiesterase